MTRLPAIAESKSRSGFARLSAELRNRVYELCLIPEDGAGGATYECSRSNEYMRGICVQTYEQHDRYSEFTSEPWGSLTSLRCQPAITRVSQQIRQETLPVYYGINEFLAYGDDVQDVKYWLKSISESNASMIKCFRLFQFDCNYAFDSETSNELAEELQLYGLPTSFVKLHDSWGRLEWDGQAEVKESEEGKSEEGKSEERKPEGSPNRDSEGESEGEPEGEPEGESKQE